jgi:hypothetical protein
MRGVDMKKISIRISHGLELNERFMFIDRLPAAETLKCLESFIAY